MMTADEQQALRKAHIGHDIRLYGAERTGVFLVINSEKPGDHKVDAERTDDHYEIDLDSFSLSDGECRTCEVDLTLDEVRALVSRFYTIRDDAYYALSYAARFRNREALKEILSGLKDLPPEDFEWLRDLVNGLELVALLDSKPLDKEPPNGKAPEDA